MDIKSSADRKLGGLPASIGLLSNFNSASASLANGTKSVAFEVKPRSTMRDVMLPGSTSNRSSSSPSNAFAVHSSLERGSRPLRVVSSRMVPTGTALATNFGLGSNPTTSDLRSWTQTRLIETPVAAWTGFSASRRAAGVVRAGQAAENTVVVDGVRMPRFAPQSSMAKHYTKEDLLSLGINASNTRIYVIDDFVNRNQIAGNGPTSVKTTHGDMTAGIATAETHGLAKIVKVNYGVPGGTEAGFKYKDTVLRDLINGVIQTEARQQNKSPATVDLSHVSISMSLSQPKDIKGIAAATAAFSSRGGAFFICAGNTFYSPHAASLKNSTVVDGSNIFLGDPIPKVQLPWGYYENSGLSADGKDIRFKRPLGSSSQSVIAPSKLATRVTNGMIEYRDSYSPTGWSKLVDASRTAPDPSKPDPIGPLENRAPGNFISAKAGKEFSDWRAKAEVKAYEANGSKPLSESQDRALEKNIEAENVRRFGKDSVFTLQTYFKIAGLNTQDYEYQFMISRLPNGVSPQDIVISSRSSLDSFSMYRIDKFGQLKTLQPTSSLIEGTSWSTPKAAVSHAIWRQEQLRAASRKGGG
jgi:hypothetical protein